MQLVEECRAACSAEPLAPLSMAPGLHIWISNSPDAAVDEMLGFAGAAGEVEAAEGLVGAEF